MERLLLEGLREGLLLLLLLLLEGLLLLLLMGRLMLLLLLFGRADFLRERDYFLSAVDEDRIELEKQESWGWRSQITFLISKKMRGPSQPNS